MHLHFAVEFKSSGLEVSTEMSCSYFKSEALLSWIHSLKQPGWSDIRCFLFWLLTFQGRVEAHQINKRRDISRKCIWHFDWS